MRDPYRDQDDQERELLERCGLLDPFRLEWEREHDERLDAQDRATEKAGRRWGRDEINARLTLYPDRLPSSDVTPLGRVA